MFSLRVNFLTGRAVCAAFHAGDSKGEPEWPPHPARLFAALVSAWGDTLGSGEQRAALQWLEEQPLPVITGHHLSQFSKRTSPTAFVPVNDRTLFEAKYRQPRRFASVTPAVPQLHYVWPESQPSVQHRESLTQLVRRVSYLGHSSSLVSVVICDEAPTDGETLVPTDVGDLRIRVATPGRLEYLEKQHKLFMAEPGKTFRPNAGATASYGWDRGRPADTGAATGHFGDLLIFKRHTGPRLPLASTIQLTSAMRGAVIKAAAEPVPEVISGHAPGGGGEHRPSHRPHLAFIPLADVGHTHARGHTMGLAAVLPRDLTEEERQACLRALGGILSPETLTGSLRMAAAGVWQVRSMGIETAPVALRRETWTRPSKQWASVTPYVFDRFPNRKDADEVNDLVALSCDRAGLPRPVAVVTGKVSQHLGVPIASAFPALPARKGKPMRWHCHVTLCFDQPIVGPVLIGAGRFYGYGLCRPLIGFE